MTGLSSFPSGGLAVVIGATGGIGSALYRQLESTGQFAQVMGVSRSSSPSLDLTQEASIAEAAAMIAAQPHDLRLVIVATGILHGGPRPPEKTWRELDPEAMAHAFAINATGPALLMKHLLPLLPRHGKAVFAAVSARVGSIGDNKLGGWYAYRAAKAALNQFIHTAAIELARSRPEACCVALHPGTVATRLSSPFGKVGLDVQTPDEAAERMLSVIEGLKASDSGGFFDHKGLPILW